MEYFFVNVALQINVVLGGLQKAMKIDRKSIGIKTLDYAGVARLRSWLKITYQFVVHLVALPVSLLVETI